MTRAAHIMLRVLPVLAVAAVWQPRAAAQCELFRASGVTFDLAGDSVSVHGDWLAYTQRTVVRVLRWTGAAWVPAQNLQFANTVRSVDIHDDVLVAGVLGQQAIHVYRRNGVTWQPETTILERWSPSAFGGRTLDLHGDLLITCDGLDVGAWIYRDVGGTWVQEYANSFHWDSVATDGVTCVLGTQASFWVYRRTGGQWLEDYAWSPDSGAEHVDVAGDLLVSSQPERAFVFAGAEVFRRCDDPPQVWCSEDIYFNTTDAALAGITLAIATENEIGLYRDNGGTWNGIDILSASGTNDSFGHIIEMDAESIVVGAPYDDAGGTDAGSIYVFRRDVTCVAPEANGFELGTCLFPFDTLHEGLANLTPQRMIVVASGTYSESPLVLDAPVVITASGGTARIE